MTALTLRNASNPLLRAPSASDDPNFAAVAEDYCRAVPERVPGLRREDPPLPKRPGEDLRSALRPRVGRSRQRDRRQQAPSPTLQDHRGDHSPPGSPLARGPAGVEPRLSPRRRVRRAGSDSSTLPDPQAPSGPALPVSSRPCSSRARTPPASTRRHGQIGRLLDAHSDSLGSAVPARARLCGEAPRSRKRDLDDDALASAFCWWLHVRSADVLKPRRRAVSLGDSTPRLRR